MPHVFPLCTVTRSITKSHRAPESLPTRNEVEETLSKDEEKDYDLVHLFGAIIPSGLQGQPLHANFSGLYRVIKKVSSNTYDVATPDRHRSQHLSHIENMKENHGKEPADPVIVGVTCCPPVDVY